MSSSVADEKILSYEDVVLRRSDLDILSGPYFLNDRIIEFYFSYLASSSASQDVLLVPPSICFWITNCPDQESLKEFVEPLKFPDKKVIIFSVNNNDDVTQAEGGSHWSLLAYDRRTNVFVHHDSMAGSNSCYAKRLYKGVSRFIGVSDACFVEYPNSPQQKNGYDCGLYVTAIAEVICRWYENGGSDKDTDLWFSNLKAVESATVSKTRKEILELIKDLMAKK